MGPCTSVGYRVTHIGAVAGTMPQFATISAAASSSPQFAPRRPFSPPVWNVSGGSKASTFAAALPSLQPFPYLELTAGSSGSYNFIAYCDGVPTPPVPFSVHDGTAPLWPQIWFAVGGASYTFWSTLFLLLLLFTPAFLFNTLVHGVRVSKLRVYGHFFWAVLMLALAGVCFVTPVLHIVLRFLSHLEAWMLPGSSLQGVVDSIIPHASLSMPQTIFLGIMLLEATMLLMEAFGRLCTSDNSLTLIAPHLIPTVFLNFLASILPSLPKFSLSAWWAGIILLLLYYVVFISWRSRYVAVTGLQQRANELKRAAKSLARDISAPPTAVIR